MTLASNSGLDLAIDQTAVAKGTAIALNKSPLLGSPGVADASPLTGRKVRYHMPVLPGATGAPSSAIETAPRVDPATGQAPAAGSTAWKSVLTVTSTTEQVGELTLDYWVRWNTTVNHAADPIVHFYIFGTQ